MMKDFGNWFNDLTNELAGGAASHAVDCPDCDGQGLVETSAYDAETCETCGGSGVLDGHLSGSDCPDCGPAEPREPADPAEPREPADPAEPREPRSVAEGTRLHTAMEKALADEAQPEACETCGGRGVIDGSLMGRGPIDDEDCPDCDGTGYANEADEACTACGAYGLHACPSLVAGVMSQAMGQQIAGAPVSTGSMTATEVRLRQEDFYLAMQRRAEACRRRWLFYLPKGDE